MQTRAAVGAGSSHRLVGRANLLASVDTALDEGRSVVLTGPDGMGKSALLDAVARSRPDELVLRASGARAERWIGGAVLADLRAQVPPVPRPDDLTADDLGTCGPAWLGLLAACARERPVLAVLAELVPAAPAAGVRLTEVESTVAGLVARGSSNREIAAALFVSVKTVEATLTRVYRKVGVRSRTQLSARLSGTR